MTRWLATALRWAANRLDGGEVCRGPVMAPAVPSAPRTHQLYRDTTGCPLGGDTTQSALTLGATHIARARSRRVRT